MAISSSAPDLPSSTSPSLALVHPTSAEKMATWHINCQSWRGRLSAESYIRRESVLADQSLTRDGGMTFWILVDTSHPTSAPRQILASCETYRKRALIARGNNRVEEVVSHAIGSVYCSPQLRGQGYAARMMKELGMSLDTWQQEDGRRTDFTVLFSDIGKKFYSKLGWQPFPSSHIALPRLANDRRDSHYNHLPVAKLLHTTDLAELCRNDETQLRLKLETLSSQSSKTQVTFIPDLQTYQWHHAREEFLAKELVDRVPGVKGAKVGTEPGKRVWCVWTRTFGDNEAENVLHILRLVIEGETESKGPKSRFDGNIADVNASSKEQVLAAASVLYVAQREATEWTMQQVWLWNPTPWTMLAARELHPSARIIEREKESIPSLRWHGVEPKGGRDVEWFTNEKYGWC
ncbi:hypothetical protein MMC07_004494 [Pseudocyphellaria aurata]|nr:hypothetical protein [Pseudocyphellaria aurata]